MRVKFFSITKYLNTVVHVLVLTRDGHKYFVGSYESNIIA